MAISKALEAAALAACDSEPIRIPGSIQNFGALIATESDIKEIVFASANCETYFGTSAKDLLGMSLDEIMGNEVTHDIRNTLAHSTAATQREHVCTLTLPGGKVQISAHRSDERAILEIMPLSSTADNDAAALDQVRFLLGNIQGVGDVQSLLEIAVKELRAMTGFDRVKAYRFLPDGAGEVVAEARGARVESYLGLRYPASDIPNQARDLFRTSPIRILADIRAENEALLSHGERPPLDMSLALLRGSSPVHTKYLENMGVRSTMSLPILVSGKLWGLFALHHLTPHFLNPNLLMASELAGKFLTMQIEQGLHRHHERIIANSMRFAGNLVGIDDNDVTTSQYWSEAQEELTRMVAADGIFYRVDDQIQGTGSKPGTDTISKLCVLAQASPDGILARDDLQAQFSPNALDSVGGCLALALADHPKTTLLFFRNVIEKNVAWAGNPKKEIKETKDGVALMPRNSFDQYKQIVRDRSDTWTSDELEIAAALREALTRAVQTKEDMKKNRHRLGILVHELNHRVRNILALIRSLSNQARDSAESLEDYATALEQRILALAGTHDLVVRQELSGVSLTEILERELGPFLAAAEIPEALSGPPVLLGADVAPIVALVVHELIVNAAKHGALSAPGGRIRVSWCDKDDGLSIAWRESDGPPVRQPERTGFGRALIERSFTYEFDGTSDLRFMETGIEADFWLPERFIDWSISDQPPAMEAVTTSSHAPRDPNQTDSPLASAQRGNALIVEDNYVLASDLKTLMRRLGFGDIETTPTVGDALAALQQHSFSMAMVDINLRGETSYPVARALMKAGIPFAFVTGYGDFSDMPSEFKSVHVITKPISSRSLSDFVREVEAG